MLESGAAPTRPSDAPPNATVLVGPLFYVARGMWLCLFLLCSAVLAAAVLYHLAPLSDLEPPPVNRLRDLLESDYWRWLLPLVLDLLFVLVFVTVGLIIALRRSNDWLVLAVSVALIINGVTTIMVFANLRYDRPQWDALAGFLE